MLRLKTFLKQPFFTGSLLMLFGVNLYNFGQMIFHLITGRLLGRTGYSDVAVIVSILGLVIIVQQSFGLTIVKFVSAGKNEKIIKNFTRWVFLWSLWLGIILSLFFFILTPHLVDFLHINQPNAMLILSPVIVLLVFFNSAKSVFQGLLRFGSYVSVHLSEVIIKLLLSVAFISIGWGVMGVMVAIVIAIICTSALTYFLISDYVIGKRDRPPEIIPLIKYSVPVFFLSLSITSMTSVDIILVKHFFSADDAGLYAALARLGSIAFFGAAPIANAMFPFISQNHSIGRPYKSFFYLSFLLVLVISISVVVLYKIYPVPIIKFLFGSQFIGGSEILWWFGVYMLLLGLAFLFTQFYFSIGKTRTVVLFGLAAILQIVLICFIHPTLVSVIQMSIISVGLLVGALLTIYRFSV